MSSESRDGLGGLTHPYADEEDHGGFAATLVSGGGKFSKGGGGGGQQTGPRGGVFRLVNGNKVYGPMPKGRSQKTVAGVPKAKAMSSAKAQKVQERKLAKADKASDKHSESMKSLLRDSSKSTTKRSPQVGSSGPKTQSMKPHPEVIKATKTPVSSKPSGTKAPKMPKPMKEAKAPREAKPQPSRSGMPTTKLDHVARVASRMGQGLKEAAHSTAKAVLVASGQAPMATAVSKDIKKSHKFGFTGGLTHSYTDDDV